MSKKPISSNPQRQQQNDHADALNKNRGTTGSNPTNAHTHGNRGKQLNPNKR
ncbi:hypothetical protein [Pseudomonas sp. lyk4-TYG-107]|uniref:hypothetical protein n=1 Tax=Pseudomonas sp. lyk4-TYG-107 TaxID=3040317 RepID=UPI002555C652|nr:hypothetical protein [Pseudomonas sp. lyk4-TYG-107]